MTIFELTEDWMYFEPKFTDIFNEKEPQRFENLLDAKKSINERIEELKEKGYKVKHDDDYFPIKCIRIVSLEKVGYSVDLMLAEKDF